MPPNLIHKIMSELKEIPVKSTKKQETERASAITLAIEMASAFQLYSYRVISHEAFFQQTTDLVNQFNFVNK